MNSLTQILLWCPIQVTVLAIAALAIGGLAGRRRPAAGAVVAAAALFAVVGVTATALSPWPDWAISWERLPWHNAGAAVAAPANAPALRAAIQPAEQVVDDGHVYEPPITGRATAAQRPTESFAYRAWSLVAGNWITIAAAFYLVGVSLMLLRIGLGLRAVAGYRRNSHPITDRSLNELTDVVCAQLGYTQGIELRETTRLSTPATVGWLRPILLLPADWRRWTEDERHAVLAHEIEHVRRNDFAAWMAAQIGVALHFYHPLVHWLAKRLRLQQELAADAAAARAVGGQRKYVTTLAAMALRQSDEPLAWPARAFFPNSKTFLRRIDMLHRSKSLRGDVSRPAVCLSLAAVLLAAVCAAGIRGSVAGEQPTASSENVGDNGDATGDTALLALNQTEQPHPVERGRPPEAQRRLRRDMMKLKQIALAMHSYHAKHGHFPPAVVMGPDGKTPHSWRVELLPFLDNQALFDSYKMNEPWDSETNKKVLAAGADFFRSPFDDPVTTDSGYYVLVGPGTIFEGTNGIKIPDVTDGTSNTLLVVEAKRSIPWTKPEDIPFDPEKPLPELGGFLKGEFAAAIADGSARVYDAAKAKDQLKWLIMRNDGHVIDVQKLGPDPRRAANSNQPGLKATSNAARNMNNLKQLALAMHNYHDVKFDDRQSFPPAVVQRPGDKFPRSWRVEMLPFVGAANLYAQYHRDEPWDSENNKKILAQMPDVFRSPYDDPNSTNSGYYVLVGPGTVFEGSEGVKISDITDGTSNTLMIVEAKRSIPWTKPEDISYDPDKPVPELGGFVKGEFAAALADGSAHRFQAENIAPGLLRRLIMRNDGQVVEWNKINDGR